MSSIVMTTKGTIITTDGPQGPRGNGLLSGHGAPASNFGNINDFYYDVDTLRFYGPKTDLGWGPYVTLAWPESWLGSFPTDPTARENSQPLVVGDTYYNQTSHKRREYDGTGWHDYDESAQQAAAQTAADRIATGQDVLTTHADVQLTHADVQTTHADVQLTHDDVTLTHADVVLTHADVVAANNKLAEVNAAGATQINLIEDAGDDEIADVGAAGAAQIANVGAAGATQVANVGAAGTTQIGNVNAAGTTQVGNVNAAGTTQVGNVNTAGTTQVTNINTIADTQVARIAGFANIVAYPVGAATNVPRGILPGPVANGGSVGTITPGSGGTNGTFTLGWTGGNFSVNPVGTFTVAGNVLTAINIDPNAPGEYIGASPVPPTPVFSASAGLTGAAVALTAQFLVGSGKRYWAQSTDGKQANSYQNVGGVATARTDVGPLPTVLGVSYLATIPVAKRVADMIRSATLGRSTIKAMFLPELGITEYAPNVVLSWQSQDDTGLVANLHTTLFSGANPRPLVDAVKGIFFNAQAGLTVGSGVLTRTSNFAIHYSFEIPVSRQFTLKSDMTAYATASGVQGEIYEVTGDTRTIYTPDPTMVEDQGYADTELVRGFYQCQWDKSCVSLSPILNFNGATNGYYARITTNRLGQAVFFLNGPGGQPAIYSLGKTKIVGNGRHTLSIFRDPATQQLIMFLDGQEVGMAETVGNTYNITDLNALWINGAGRGANNLLPINGTQVYVKALVVTDGDSWSTVENVHNILASYASTPQINLPYDVLGVVKTGQSLAQGSIDTSSDTWANPNTWNGQVTRENAAHSADNSYVTHEVLPRVYAHRFNSYARYNRIGPLGFSANSAGTPSGYDLYTAGGGGVENVEHGMFRQIQAHVKCPNVAWAVTSVGGTGSFALLTARSNPPIPLQSLRSGDEANYGYTQYEVLLRGIAEQVAYWQMRGRRYRVKFYYSQQGFAGLTAAQHISFYDQLNADVKTLTGQVEDIYYFIPQVNVSSNGTSNAAINIDNEALIIMEGRGSRLIYCTGPVYMGSSHIHYYRLMYRWIGERDGKVIARVIFDGNRHAAVRPRSLAIVGNAVRMKFHTGGYMLSLGATNANNIPAVVQTGGIDTHGFEYSGGGLTITSIAKVTATVTFTFGLCNWAGHGFAVNDPVRFYTTGTLPNTLMANTTYYVSATGLTTNGFYVSAVPGGPAITSGSTATGTQTGTSCDTIMMNLSGTPALGHVVSYMNAGRIGNVVDDDPAVAFYRDLDWANATFTGGQPAFNQTGSLNDIRNWMSAFTLPLRSDNGVYDPTQFVTYPYVTTAVTDALSSNIEYNRRERLKRAVVQAAGQYGRAAISCLLTADGAKTYRTGTTLNEIESIAPILPDSGLGFGQSPVTYNGVATTSKASPYLRPAYVNNNGNPYIYFPHSHTAFVANDGTVATSGNRVPVFIGQNLDVNGSWSLDWIFRMPALAATYVSVAAMNADMPNRTVGDLVKVDSGDPRPAAASGAYERVPADALGPLIALDSAFTDGYYVLGSQGTYSKLSGRLLTFFDSTNTAGKYAMLYANIRGQLLWYNYDGTRQGTGVTLCHDVVKLAQSERVHLHIEKTPIGGLALTLNGHERDSTGNDLAYFAGGNVDRLLINANTDQTNAGYGQVPYSGFGQFFLHCLCITQGMDYTAHRRVSDALAEFYGTPKRHWHPIMNLIVCIDQSRTSGTDDASSSPHPADKSGWSLQIKGKAPNGLISVDSFTRHPSQVNDMSSDPSFGMYAAESALFPHRLGAVNIKTNWTGGSGGAGRTMNGASFESIEWGMVRELQRDPELRNQHFMFIGSTYGGYSLEQLTEEDVPIQDIHQLRDPAATVTKPRTILYRSIEAAVRYANSRGQELRPLALMNVQAETNSYILTARGGVGTRRRKEMRDLYNNVIKVLCDDTTRPPIVITKSGAVSSDGIGIASWNSAPTWNDSERLDMENQRNSSDFRLIHLSGWANWCGPGIHDPVAYIRNFGAIAGDRVRREWCLNERAGATKITNAVIGTAGNAGKIVVTVNRRLVLDTSGTDARYPGVYHLDGLNGTGYLTYGFLFESHAWQPVTFAEQPSSGDSITINGAAYTFVNVLTTGTQVLIGSTLAQTMANFVAAVNGSAEVDPSGQYTEAGLIPNVDVWAYLYSASVVRLFANAVGVTGNAVTLVKSGANISVGGATLTGGDNTRTIGGDITFVNNTSTATILIPITGGSPKVGDLVKVMGTGVRFSNFREETLRNGYYKYQTWPAFPLPAPGDVERNNTTDSVLSDFLGPQKFFIQG